MSAQREHLLQAVLLLLVAAAGAAPQHQGTGGRGDCYSKSLGRYFSVGETWRESGCTQAECVNRYNNGSPGVLVLGCRYIIEDQLKPGCSVVEADPEAVWPSCCRRVTCDGITARSIDGGLTNRASVDTAAPAASAPGETRQLPAAPPGGESVGDDPAPPSSSIAADAGDGSPDILLGIAGMSPCEDENCPDLATSGSCPEGNCEPPTPTRPLDGMGRLLLDIASMPRNGIQRESGGELVESQCPGGDCSLSVAAVVAEDESLFPCQGGNCVSEILQTLARDAQGCVGEECPSVVEVLPPSLDDIASVSSPCQGKECLPNLLVELASIEGGSETLDGVESSTSSPTPAVGETVVVDVTNQIDDANDVAATTAVPASEPLEEKFSTESDPTSTLAPPTTLTEFEPVGAQREESTQKTTKFPSVPADEVSDDPSTESRPDSVTAYPTDVNTESPTEPPTESPPSRPTRPQFGQRTTAPSRGRQTTARGRGRQTATSSRGRQRNISAIPSQRKPTSAPSRRRSSTSFPTTSTPKRRQTTTSPKRAPSSTSAPVRSRKTTARQNPTAAPDSSQRLAGSQPTAIPEPTGATLKDGAIVRLPLSDASNICLTDNGGCSHHCSGDISGAVRCGCPPQMRLHEDGKTCLVDEDRPRLLFSSRDSLHLMDLDGSNVEAVASELTNAVGVDYDWQRQCFFWTVVRSTGSIDRLCHHGPPKALHRGADRPDNLAVDWVTGNIYWTDGGSGTIQVSDGDGRFRRSLISDGLRKPRAICVDPEAGRLYYTDWAEPAFIGTAGMDGSGPRVLITGDLVWPNALTISRETQQLFWADAQQGHIEVADMQGRNRRVLLRSPQGVTIRPLMHIFSLAIYQKELFWSSWQTNSIIKYNGTHAITLRNSSTLPMGVRVFHSSQQKPLARPNPCESGGGCATLCLLRPDGGRACSCPDHFRTDDEGATCTTNCTRNQFICKETFKCLPHWLICNGEDDCGDASDEPEFCPPFNCERGEFQCRTGQCVPHEQICDGEPDCLDGGDELSCSES